MIKPNFHQVSTLQSYDAIEVFAGVAVLTQCLREKGYSTCSLDIKDWMPWRDARIGIGKPISKNNPLDLSTTSGFALLNFMLEQFHLCGSLRNHGYIGMQVIFKIIYLKSRPLLPTAKVAFDRNHEGRPEPCGSLWFGMFDMGFDIKRLNI